MARLVPFTQSVARQEGWCDWLQTSVVASTWASPLAAFPARPIRYSRNGPLPKRPDLQFAQALDDLSGMARATPGVL